MIKGNKVGLRALEKEDLNLLRDWRNLPSFRKNFREVRELSLSDQESWFESLQQTKHVNFMFIIVDLKSNERFHSMFVAFLIKPKLCTIVRHPCIAGKPPMTRIRCN